MENEPTQEVQDDSNDLNVPEKSDEDSEEVNRIILPSTAQEFFDSIIPMTEDELVDHKLGEQQASEALTEQLEANELELIDIAVEHFHSSVEDELRAKIKSLTIANETATFLFSKILKGYTFNDQIKQWLELNRVRE